MDRKRRQNENKRGRRRKGGLREEAEGKKGRGNKEKEEEEGGNRKKEEDQFKGFPAHMKGGKWALSPPKLLFSRFPKRVMKRSKDGDVAETPLERGRSDGGENERVEERRRR